jgi:glycosyltransferase involved in cell wall biosynthesis
MTVIGRFLNAQVEEVFVDAMRVGYAALKPQGKSTWGHMLDGKKFVYERGPWQLEDRYVVGENDHSAGWTFISFEGRVVWQMHYEGWYKKEAVPLLKTALRANYDVGIFHGGRGPAYFALPECPDMAYVNCVIDGEFKKFSGVEAIEMRSGALLASISRQLPSLSPRLGDFLPCRALNRTQYPVRWSLTILYGWSTYERIWLPHSFAVVFAIERPSLAALASSSCFGEELRAMSSSAFSLFAA